MEKRKRFPKIDEASLLETMLAAPDELIVVVNKNGYIENMSQAYGDFLGIQVQNAIGRHVTEVIENTRMDIVVKTGVPETGETQDIHGEKMIATRIPIRKNGMVIGAYGRVLVRNTRELHMLHDKLSSIEMELNMYKRTFEKINTAKYTVDDIIGDCSIMQDLKDSVRKVAKTNSNVLIMGESGTGKELFAHSIHAGSMRRKAPFVCVNCGSIPEQLIESELFGYEKGAFTGASSTGKIGKIELANGGTLFLDEIGELPPHIQSKLLQLIQEKTIERVSGIRRIELDIRLIVATNRNLEEEVHRGLFRSDLFYRLNVIRLHIPPLRQRPEDILPLAHRFLTRFCEEYHKDLTLSPRLLSYLEQCPWPGNVRQLENMMERLVICAQDPVVDIGVLSSEQMGASPLPLPAEGGTLAQQMETFEGHIIRDAYAKYGTSVAVAKALGISQPTAARKIAKYVK